MVGRSTPLMIRALTVSTVASLNLRSHFACDWSTSHVALHTACRASAVRERKSVHHPPCFKLELWGSFRFELSSKPDMEGLPGSIVEPCVCVALFYYVCVRCFFLFFWFGIHTASVLSTAETYTGGGTVLGKPGGSPARRHSRNGPWNEWQTHTHVVK